MHPPLNKPTTCSFVCVHALACLLKDLSARVSGLQPIWIHSRVSGVFVWAFVRTITVQTLTFGSIESSSSCSGAELVRVFTLGSSSPTIPYKPSEWMELTNRECLSQRSTQLNHSILDGACLKTNMKKCFIPSLHWKVYNSNTLAFEERILWSWLRYLKWFENVIDLLEKPEYTRNCLFSLDENQNRMWPSFLILLTVHECLLLIMMIIIILAEITKEYSWKANWIVRPVCMTTRTQTKA